MKRLNQLLVLMIRLGIVCACALFLLPAFSQSLTEIRQAAVLLSYEDEWSAMAEDELERMRESADQYNRLIYESQKNRLFTYQGEDATDGIYEKMLSKTPGGQMGTLIVPSIDLRLPIAHGTKTDTLDYECGHLYGSSLPIGGAGTHCVLAGHTGLTSAVLFSNLRDVREGEHFYLASAGEMHDYKVIAINIVRPGEEWGLLQIEGERDLVTLYTCTPYGINDHRLLVTGERVYPNPASDAENDRRARSAMRKRREARVRIGLMAWVLIGVSILVFRRKREQTETRRGGKPVSRKAAKRN